MDNDTPNAKISEHELKVLLKVLTKSVENIHKKQAILIFIAGLLIGFGAAALLLNLAGLMKTKQADVELYLKKTDETIQEVREIKAMVSSLTAAKTVAVEGKPAIDDKVPSALQGKGMAVRGKQGNAAPGGIKVYIHYAREEDKRNAEAFSVYLKSKGYVFVETQKIPHKHRDIRYFYGEDRKAAELLGKHFDKFIAGLKVVKKLNLKIRNLTGRYPGGQKGVLEMWVFF